MQKLTSLLIGCSLALAGAAMAQQPVEQQSPSKGKRAREKTHAPQAQPRPNAAKPKESPAKQTGAIKERAGAKAQKGEPKPKHEKAARGAKEQGQERRNRMKGPPTNSAAPPRATAAKAAASVSTRAARRK